MTSPAQYFSNLITAANTFSDVMQLDRGQTAALSIVDPNAGAGGAGSFTTGTTVVIQRAYNKSMDWRDVASYTAPQELGFVAECSMSVRMGVKTAALSSGDTVRLEGKSC